MTPVPMPATSRKPRTNATPKWKRNDRRRRGWVRVSASSSTTTGRSPAGDTPSAVEALRAWKDSELGRSVIRCSYAVGRRRVSSVAGAISSRVQANVSRDGRLGRRDWDAGPPRNVARLALAHWLLLQNGRGPYGSIHHHHPRRGSARARVRAVDKPRAHGRV